MDPMAKKGLMSVMTAALLFIAAEPFETFENVRTSCSDRATDLTRHAPIRITSNDDIKAVASSGSGTQADPYVISNLEISATNRTNAIVISGTTAFLIIKNCYLHDSWDGIHLQNSSNIIIKENRCRNNVASGIALMRSCNNYLSNNVCEANGCAIYLLESHMNSILDNRSSDEYAIMYLCWSNENFMMNNAISKIDLHTCRKCAIEGITCSSVNLYKCDLPTISGNTENVSVYDWDN